MPSIVAALTTRGSLILCCSVIGGNLSRNIPELGIVTDVMDAQRPGRLRLLACDVCRKPVCWSDLIDHAHQILSEQLRTTPAQQQFDCSKIALSFCLMRLTLIADSVAIAKSFANGCCHHACLASRQTECPRCLTIVRQFQSIFNSHALSSRLSCGFSPQEPGYGGGSAGQAK
jgi:hypothetical protein